MESKVKLISLTQGAGEFEGKTAEEMIVYCARVSSPRSDKFDSPAGLLNYCIKHGHWSIFEMANMTLEINTSRAISAQIIRHRSFAFQEFSQRYAEVPSVEDFEIRMQGKTNRQVGDEVANPKILDWSAYPQSDIHPERVRYSSDIIDYVNEHILTVYNRLIEAGVARESARMILPMASSSKLYMNGTVRSWIHYIDLRTQEDTQKEHRELAEAAKVVFCEQLPTIAKALGWLEK